MVASMMKDKQLKSQDPFSSLEWTENSVSSIPVQKDASHASEKEENVPPPPKVPVGLHKRRSSTVTPNSFNRLSIKSFAD